MASFGEKDVEFLKKAEPDEDKFGSYLVDELRGELKFHFSDCVEASAVVFRHILQHMHAHMIEKLDLSTIKNLSKLVAASQDNMSKECAKDSLDYKTASALIDALEYYRKGSDNRERCWPGGSFASGPSETNRSNSSLSPPDCLSGLTNIFDQANPQVVYHVIEYPGKGSPYEFKLVEILADELQWYLQNFESTPGDAQRDILNGIGHVLVDAVGIHEDALSLTATNTTIQSVIFRILRRIISEQKNHVTAPRIKSMSYFAKLATGVLSVLYYDKNFQHDRNGGVPLEEIFPEIDLCLTELVGFVSTITEVKLQDQIVALLVAYNGLLRAGIDDSLTEEESHGKLLSAFWNSIETPGKDDFALYVEQTVLEWLNFDSGGLISGVNPKENFGLAHSLSLISRFLKDLVAIKVGSAGMDDKTFGPKLTYFVDLASDRVKDDEYFLASDGDCDIVREVCGRMMDDCDSDDERYKTASSLRDVIAKIRRQ